MRLGQSLTQHTHTQPKPTTESGSTFAWTSCGQPCENVFRFDRDTPARQEDRGHAPRKGADNQPSSFRVCLSLSRACLGNSSTFNRKRLLTKPFLRRFWPFFLPLAQAARALVYEDKAQIWTGPVLESCTVSANAIVRAQFRPFAMLSIYKSDHFTKTGSGQT